MIQNSVRLKDKRRERGTLTRDEIAEVSLRLLDEHGIDAVTMRQIAAELGVAPMSLYVHFANKNEILAAATDIVMAEMPLADLAAEPRLATVRFFEGYHEGMVRHPSVARTIGTAPIFGPAAFASTDSMFAVMANAGLSEEQAVTAMTALTAFTIGFTMFAIARDQTDSGIADRRRERLRGIDPTAFPHLERVRDHVLDLAFDVQFSDGLVRLVHSLIPET